MKQERAEEGRSDLGDEEAAAEGGAVWRRGVVVKGRKQEQRLALQLYLLGGGLRFRRRQRLMSGYAVSGADMAQHAL